MIKIIKKNKGITGDSKLQNKKENNLLKKLSFFSKKLFAAHNNLQKDNFISMRGTMNFVDKKEDKGVYRHTSKSSFFSKKLFAAHNNLQKDNFISMRGTMNFVDKKEDKGVYRHTSKLSFFSKKLFAAHNNKIVISCGGTGGHMFPAISIANFLISKGFEIIFITDKRGVKFFTKTSYNNKIIIKTCLSMSISGSVFNKLKASLITSLGCIKALYLYINYWPKKTISFGGYASFPASIASIVFRRPLIIHEQNAVIGKTNKMLSKYASYIALSFKDTKGIPANVKTIYTGYPIRDEINNAKGTKVKNKITILITGGSQGAKIFNDLSYVFCDFPEDLRKKLNIIQQVVGTQELIQIKKLYDKCNIQNEVKPFFTNIFDCIASADLVIGRSGAGSCFENYELNKISLFIPLKIASDNHQELNARNFEKNGCIILKENDYNFSTAKIIIENLIKNKDKLKLKKDKVATPNVREEFLKLVK